MCFVLFSFTALFSQQRADRPPEYKEFLAAVLIEDLKARAARFSIPQAEQEAETRLSELEKERGFIFKERHSQIDRQDLLAVFFSPG
jgi:hypothetical protein